MTEAEEKLIKAECAKRYPTFIEANQIWNDCLETNLPKAMFLIDEISRLKTALMAIVALAGRDSVEADRIARRALGMEEIKE